MAIDRIKRVNELLRRELASIIYHIMDAKEIDLSAITITKVITSRDLRNATVLVSVRDHHQEREAMMSVFYRHRKELQSLVSKNVVLKYTPRLSFKLDTSLEQGDHVLDVLSKLEETLPYEPLLPEENPDDETTEL